MKLSCLGVILIILISHSSYGQTKNNWETKSPMKIHRAFHSMAAANGKIYVIGGSTGGANEFKDTPTVEMYDPQSGQWVYKKELPKAITTSCAVTIDDKIYLVGGQEDVFSKRLNTLMMYDCLKDKWEKKASMNIARSFHCAVALNNKIYAIGGRENDNELKVKSKDSLAVYTIEEYDIKSDKWVIKSILPFKNFAIGAVVLNNKIYILFDSTNHSTLSQSALLEEYDPERNHFSFKANLTPSKCDAAMVVYNNKIYLLGGWNHGALSIVEEYDPVSNTWTEKPEMPYKVQNHQAVILKDKIYITGGIKYFSDGKNEKKAEVISFNPNP